MAERAAKVRLELHSAGFLTMMRQVERSAKELGDHIEDIGEASASADRKVTPLMGSLKKGAGAAKDSMVELGRQLKSTLAQAATLGGALGVGAAVKEATDLQQQYRNVAFSLELASGKAVEWQQVQRAVEDAADQTAQRLGPLTGAFDVLARAGGLDFAKQQLELVGTAATATGNDVALLANLAGDLRQKFGLSGEAMKGAFASVLEAGAKAGITGEQLGDEMGSIASAGQAAGLKGAEGLNVLLATLSKVRPKVKDIAEAGQGIEQTFERLSDPGFFQNIEKAAGVKLRVDVESTDVTERLRKVLGAGVKARAELFAATTGREELAALKALADPFTEAFETARAAGDGVTEATKKGIDAYDAALKKAAESTGDFAKLQKQATDNLDDPKRQLDQAINNFTKAFQKPEAIEAINKLAKAMPQFADLLADVVSFGTSHPLLTGAGFIGAKVGGAAVGSMAGDLAGGLFSRAGGVGTKIGESAGDSLVTTASKHSGWAGVGASIGATAAAAIAAAVVVDQAGKLEKETGGQASRTAKRVLSSLPGFDKSGSFDAGQAFEDVVDYATNPFGTLKKFIKQGRSVEGDLRHFDVHAEGRMDAAARSEANARRQAEAEAAIAADKALRDVSKSGGRSNEVMNRFASAGERAIRVLNGLGSAGGRGDGTNGLPPAPGTLPGSYPR